MTADEVRAELAKVDFSNAGDVRRASRWFASRLNGDAGDLLHEAVRKALTSRSCPSDVSVEQVLASIMRSMASTALRSRERRGNQEISLPVEEVIDRLAIGNFVVRTAEEIAEIERVRTVCADALEQLARENPRHAALIEGIGFDLRGRDLATFLGVSTSELATMRKALKRHAARLWPDVQSELDR
ncbi:hypothetical protein KY084_10930 [Stakelama sp. CBK3Z-3]|uniref:Sigma-70 family RNA polymerase sigma factor n=1 Tax=Stakelama flava TaxID=2860338 RepID=A0ABS6XME4_9SPHN|nr:hypothetical protein [Stakelama flava]MBW4331385.1 hypothetical protein [Stakelama flava]